jgi:hypothetical protein
MSKLRAFFSESITELVAAIVLVNNLMDWIQCLVVAIVLGFSD